MNNWILIALVSGLAAGIISFFLIGDWRIALIIAIVTTILVILNNPKRRFIKAFWVILSMLFVLNKFFFELVGQASGIDFKVGSNEVGSGVSIFLILLAGLALVLDYLERNEKLKGTFLEIKSNKVGNITGNNNQINQH